MGVTSSGLQSICLLQSCKSQDMNGQAGPCTPLVSAKTSTPPHAVSFCDFCLFSFLDTTAADMSDTQEQVTLTHPLKFLTRKFMPFFLSARRFFMMHKEFCNSDADLFGGFAGRHNYSQSLFFLILFISQPFFTRFFGFASLLTGYKG